MNEVKEYTEEFVGSSPSISNLKKIEEETIDLKPFEGEKSIIERMEQIQVPSKFNERGFQWCLKIYARGVTAGSKVIYPTELFNLKEDSNGNACGWHSNSNLQRFLERTDCFHPEQLPGQAVMLRLRKKGDQFFLGFITQ